MRTPCRRRSAHGFTLIELLIVLTLITILSSMGLAQYPKGVPTPGGAVVKEDLGVFPRAIDKYYAKKNRGPVTLDALVSEGSLRKIPADPFTRSSASWQTVPA